MGKKIVTIVKYVLAVALVIATYSTTQNISIVGVGLLELFSIFLLSNWLLEKSKIFYVLHYLLMFVFSSEMLVLLFGGNYITYVMLQNLNMLKDLSGKALIYTIGVSIVLFIIFAPVYVIEERRLHALRLLPVTVISEIVIIIGLGGVLTPFTGVCDLYAQWQNNKIMNDMIAMYAEANDSEVVEEEVSETEYVPVNATKNTVASNDSKDSSSSKSSKSSKKSSKTEEKLASVSAGKIEHSILPKGTNVIIIFVEGLSYNVISDERSIMPNARQLMNSSINFTNYYNHSFATFRGLQGQLYSGYQQRDLDPNHLSCIMDVLRANGYYNAFINTEPECAEFCKYLSDMPFDEIITDDEKTYGHANSIPDCESYGMLWDSAEKFADSGVPFSLMIYTFGTHASLDSIFEKFGDGTDRELNKFYECDAALGDFLEKFNSSPLADNTMLVFTTDHCTYADSDFVHAFPTHKRECVDCDEVPLFIYYQGVTMNVDAAGRNTLDMAPTVLDLLGIEKPSDFLGTSLFEAKNDDLAIDTCFWDATFTKYTGNDTVMDVSQNIQKKIYAIITNYLAKKMQ